MPANPYVVSENLSVAVLSTKEDTPALAVARYEEVKRLEGILVKLTRGYHVIQAEPSKALCRWLFSSKLAEAKTLTNDPLLPNLSTGVYHDKSICTELKDNLDFAHNVCDALCTASKEAITRLNTLKNQTTQSQVKISKIHNRWRVSSGTASIFIADDLLCRLQNMYRQTLEIKDDVHLDQTFAKRLFCLLMRYQALGGSDNISNKQGTFHEASKIFLPQAWSIFEKDLGVTMECTASPFNCTAPTFWSAFTDTDCFFGSKGNFFDATDTEFSQGGSFMADGPPEEETLARLEKRIHEVLEQTSKLDKPTSFVVGYPAWKDMSCWKNLKNSKYLVFHVKNCHTDKRLGVVHHLGNMSLFILQNDRGKKQWPVTSDVKARLNSVFGVHTPAITTGAAQQRNPMWPHAEELHREALENDHDVQPDVQPDIEDEDVGSFSNEFTANREATALMQASYNFGELDEDAHHAWGMRIIAYFNTLCKPVLPQEAETWANLAWQIRVSPNVIECRSVEPSRIGRHQFWLEGFTRLAHLGDSESDDENPRRVLWIEVVYEGPFTFHLFT